ncbi:MAG: ribbon-helix-helix domain-containing protein [Desulfurococcaceae archaeon]
MSEPVPQSQNPSPESKPRIRVATVIPREWYEKIHRYMKKKGYYSISEFLRDVIREKVLEAEEQ